MENLQSGRKNSPHSCWSGEEAREAGCGLHGDTSTLGVAKVWVSPSMRQEMSSACMKGGLQLSLLPAAELLLVKPECGPLHPGPKWDNMPPGETKRPTMWMAHTLSPNTKEVTQNQPVGSDTPGISGRRKYKATFKWNSNTSGHGEFPQENIKPSWQ